MTAAVLYSIVESPTHPDFVQLYRELDFHELRFTSMRKAIAALKTQPPAVVVAEFFYGWGNNYAGVNVSNLDVFLASLRKYAPAARVIVLAGGSDLEHIDKLTSLFDIHRVLPRPADQREMREALIRRHAGPANGGIPNPAAPDGNEPASGNSG